MVILLEKGAGELRCSEYQCDKHENRGKLENFLKTEAQRFLRDCIAPAAQVRGNASIQVISKDGLIFAQMVALLANEMWWIARVISSEEMRSYVLIHWNGPELYLKSLVLPILESVGKV